MLRDDFTSATCSTTLALAAVFAVMTVGSAAAWSPSLVGGTVGLALAHAFEAAYIAQTIVRPITSGLKKIHDGISGLAKGSSSTGAGDGVRPPCRTY